MEIGNLRDATHAGTWYNGDPKGLAAELGKYFSSSEKLSNSNNLKSIIVPHAGYRYSGPTAAKAFININPDNYNRVVVIGPSHHEYFHGCGLSPFEGFQTPFGSIKIDLEINKKLLQSSKDHFFTLEKEVDEEEHSIEMEIPFIKMLFDKKDFSIVPIMVGSNTNFDAHKEIADVLYDLYEDKQTLFVISSDFCHWGKRFAYTYYDNKYDEIWKSTESLDKMALEHISKLDPTGLNDYFKKYKNTICGRHPISIVLCMIEQYKKKYQNKKITFDCAGYSQSSHVMDMNDSSVSYAAGVNFIE